VCAIHRTRRRTRLPSRRALAIWVRHAVGSLLLSKPSPEQTKSSLPLPHPESFLRLGRAHVGFLHFPPSVWTKTSKSGKRKTSRAQRDAVAMVALHPEMTALCVTLRECSSSHLESASPCANANIPSLRRRARTEREQRLIW
jgi:hypothetical protein